MSLKKESTGLLWFLVPVPRVLLTLLSLYSPYFFLSFQHNGVPRVTSPFFSSSQLSHPHDGLNIGCASRENQWRQVIFTLFLSSDAERFAFNNLFLNLARLTAFPIDEETFRSWYFTLVLRSYQKDDDIVKACSCIFSQSNATTQIG